MKQVVYLCVGLPGSGKSTWANKKVQEEKDIVIINQDFIRTMLKGEYFYDKKYEPLVHKIAVNSLISAMDLGFNVILDQTNVSRDRRKFWVELIKNKPDYQVIYVHFGEFVNNLENRMKDPKGLTKEEWENAIYTLKSLYQPPLKEEGYDLIIFE